MVEIISCESKPPEESVKLKVLIADDHELMCRALRGILEKEPDFVVLGEVNDGEQAIAATLKLKPDIVLMDIQMPKMDGIEATRKIKELSPNTMVLVLTAFDHIEYILKILEAGASGYLLKNVIAREIPNALRSISNGDSMLSSTIMKQLLKYTTEYQIKNNSVNDIEKMTGTEIKILNLIASGVSNKAISQELDLSLNTVKKYIMDIFGKLNVHSRTAAILSARRAGLISTDIID
jgi:two-component system, NarL family, response regulator LiaR